MTHRLKISVSNELQSGDIVQCRNVTLREKMLTRLLGRQQEVIILIPDKNVESAYIPEVPEEGTTFE